MSRDLYYRINKITSDVSKEEFYGALKRDLLHYVSLLRCEYSSDVQYKPDLSDDAVETVLGVLSVLCDCIYSIDLYFCSEDLNEIFKSRLDNSPAYKKLCGGSAFISYYNSANWSVVENLYSPIYSCFYGFVSKYFCSLKLDFPVVASFEDIKKEMYFLGFKYFELSGDYTVDGKSSDCFYALTPRGDRHYCISVPKRKDYNRSVIDIIPQLKRYNSYMCNSLVCWDNLFPCDYTELFKELDELYNESDDLSDEDNEGVEGKGSCELKIVTRSNIPQ